MSENEKPKGESEEYVKFRRAMQRIVSVKKGDIVEDLPKMFRERKPRKKAKRKPQKKSDA